VPTQTDLKTTAIASTTSAVCRQSLLRRQAPGSIAGAGPPEKSAEVLVSAAPQFRRRRCLGAFLSRHLQVPDELEAGVKKTVLVRFSVSETGAVTGF
jgi:hypothetical protein